MRRRRRRRMIGRPKVRFHFMPCVPFVLSHWTARMMLLQADPAREGETRDLFCKQQFHSSHPFSSFSFSLLSSKRGIHSCWWWRGCGKNWKNPRRRFLLRKGFQRQWKMEEGDERFTPWGNPKVSSDRLSGISGGIFFPSHPRIWHTVLTSIRSLQRYRCVLSDACCSLMLRVVLMEWRNGILSFSWSGSWWAEMNQLIQFHANRKPKRALRDSGSSI